MTMYEFMVNAFYLFCGTACLAAALIILGVIVEVFRKQKNEKNGK